MKLVNVPLIDYTLESLNRSGVEEVFVFVSNYIEQVKEHIKYVKLTRYYGILVLTNF